MLCSCSKIIPNLGSLMKVWVAEAWPQPQESQQKSTVSVWKYASIISCMYVSIVLFLQKITWLCRIDEKNKHWMLAFISTHMGSCPMLNDENATSSCCKDDENHDYLRSQTPYTQLRFNNCQWVVRLALRHQLSLTIVISIKQDSCSATQVSTHIVEHL